jgi:leucyl/phenylalanyl-tRNA---protein transferase
MTDPAKPFTLDDLIDCYRRGIFPMAESRDDETLFLVDPPMRAVLPLEAFHLSSRLGRTLRSCGYEFRIDTAFSEVIRLCAESAHDRPTTWISHPIEALYQALFARGLAHSVEVWDGPQLLGGLYGVSLGGAFFGESMVSRGRDASKLALCHLVARLRSGGYRLLDCQFMTDHLRQFGVREIPRSQYQRVLKSALSLTPDFYHLPRRLSGRDISQLLIS